MRSPGAPQGRLARRLGAGQEGGIRRSGWDYPQETARNRYFSIQMLWSGELAEALARLTENHNALFIAAVGNYSAGPMKDPELGPFWAAYPAAFSGASGPYYSETIDDVVLCVGGNAVLTEGGVVRVTDYKWSCEPPRVLRRLRYVSPATMAGAS